MLIKNTSAKLYTISHGSKDYKILPAGEAVEVPNAAAKDAVIASWIDSGDLIKVAATKKSTKTESEEEVEETETEE